MRERRIPGEKIPSQKHPDIRKEAKNRSGFYRRAGSRAADVRASMTQSVFAPPCLVARFGVCLDRRSAIAASAFSCNC